ncbi:MULTISPECIES: PP2C family protein-serine/threonine phosphatase [unclassified Nocardioides]|uniref:PP2C family protein-serine/threonine phosphatase n=1 Tax=unclassified Nocardioides TaxID=2615069 RepID=UPI00362120A5
MSTPAQEADALADAGAGGERYDRVIRLAQAIFGAPVAAINLIGQHDQHTVSAVGVSVGSGPLGESVCRHTVERADILEVPDLRADERFAGFPIVAGPPQLRFYAGVPLKAPSGQLVGALCILDRVPRELGRMQQEMLADLGAVLERELAMDAEMQHAGEVQSRLLPAAPPAVAGLEMAGRVQQASEAGGDFFDWQTPVPGDGQAHQTVQVALADVMGKGLPSALLASEVRAVLRTHSRYVSLDEAIRRTWETTEASLTSNNAFVTLWAGRVDPADGALSYVDAGHGLAAIASPRGSRRLAQQHLPLGLPALDDWEVGTDTIGDDEVLAIVSDGVYDVLGSVDEALAAFQRIAARGGSAADMVSRILRYATTHGATDDLTAVVVRRDGAAS